MLVFALSHLQHSDHNHTNELRPARWSGQTRGALLDVGSQIVPSQQNSEGHNASLVRPALA